MPEPLDAALAGIRDLLVDPERLVFAVAAGRRRGAVPSAVRVELRPVRIKAGQRLQVIRHDGTRPLTKNVAWGDPAATVIDSLLAEAFGNWHVRAADRTVQLRVTKKGDAQVHQTPVPGDQRAAVPTDAASHDRAPSHLLPPEDPLFEVIGGSAAKRRQVDAFLRALVATLGEAVLRGEPAAGPPGPAGPAGDQRHRTLNLADLGCGNAYLTFAAYQYLTRLGLDVTVTGVDIRDDQRERNSRLAERLGCADRVRFVADPISEVDLDPAPDAVLALHACDTATDEALARAVRWGARWILAAPCCHHDLATQLRAAPPHGPNRPLFRDGILRERFAEVLTDAVRAEALRGQGYRVEVVEFVESRHTPRNLLLRATRGDFPRSGQGSPGTTELTGFWGVSPALLRMLGPA